MKNKRIEMGLIVGIVILFIISSVTPVVIGYRVETTKDNTELERMLDDLRFMCIDANGFSEGRYEYYKEKFLSLYESDNSNDNIIVEVEKEQKRTNDNPYKTAFKFSILQRFDGFAMAYAEP
jgi:hypothetical protein